MIREPDPTEVMPTMRPPSAPTSTVARGRAMTWGRPDCSEDRGVPLARRRARSASWTYAFTINDPAATNRAMPRPTFTTCWTDSSLPNHRRTNTPAKAAGTEPTTSHLTSSQVHGPATEMDEAAQRLHHG